jgi:hypothetical protein
MALQPITEDALRAVEEATGRPVVVRPDPSLGTLLAKLTMARGSAAAHLVTYNPLAGAVDYVLCFQCGFLLRMFKVPEAERFSLAGSWRGRKETEKLIAEHLRKKGMSFPKEIRSKMVEQFFGGIVQQLRSMPIGLRVDSWLQQSYPGLADQQKKAIDRQLNDNAASLRPDVRQIAPATVYEANVGMNAAFALFWSRTWNDPLLAVPYKSSGDLATGDKLLKLFDEIPNDPANDKKLIDAWGGNIGLTGWYEFVPYEGIHEKPLCLPPTTDTRSSYRLPTLTSRCSPRTPAPPALTHSVTKSASSFGRNLLLSRAGHESSSMPRTSRSVGSPIQSNLIRCSL